MDAGCVYTCNLENIPPIIQSNNSIAFLINESVEMEGMIRAVNLYPPTSLSRFNDNLPSDDNLWEVYCFEYIKHIKGKPRALENLRKMEDLLNSRMNVILICPCKNSYYCHRDTLANHFKDRGYIVVEN